MDKIRSMFKLSNKEMRLIVSLVLACLMLTAAALPAFAESTESFTPLSNSSGFYPVLYDNTNGLPSAEANDIAQTSDGFIWIGCYAGLVRYDGNTFERFDSTEGLSSISCLLVDSQDRLWIGTNDSGVALMQDGEFTFWDVDDGLGSSKVCELAEDAGGYIYVGTTAGVMTFSPDLDMQPLDDSRVADAYIYGIVPNGELVYFTTNDGDLFITRDRNLVNFYESEDTLIEDITTIYPDPDVPGKVYYGTENNGIYHFDVKAGPDSAEHIEIDPLYSVNDILQVGDCLWICTRGGIAYIDDDGLHTLTDLPLNSSVEKMMVDYEGNLWFTSTRLGVMKLVTNRFTDIFSNYDIPETVVNSTCLLDGKMYIGTDTGLVVIDESGVVDSVPVTSAATASGEGQGGSDLIQMLSEIRIRSIIRDSEDRLWISTWKSLGLLCYDHGVLTIFNEDDGMLSDRVRMVYETKDGKMMAAVTGGLNIIEDGKVTAAYDQSSGILNDETLIVSEAPNGDMLIGSNGDGIYIINSDGLRNIGKEDGLTSGVVMRIKYDEENKVFWLITGNSLAYMTEDYQVTTVRKFPYPDNLDLYKNSKGDIWILSSDGIYVTPAEELLANGDIEPVHYSITNGLPCITTSNSFSELTADGDLFISGRSGVAMVNIEGSLEEVDDVKMSVPFIEVNDETVYPNKKGVYMIPSEAKKVAVCGYVFDYSLTDPTVSFMLEGFDDEMMTKKRSELDPVYYTNLRGGSYTFVMELKDAMGRESKTIRTTIIKEKAFYEKTGFIVSSIVIGLALIFLFVQVIMIRKMAALEEKHKAESERERVTGELAMASQIQSGVLPHQFPPFPDRGEFDLYASMDPAREVGGDFYDYFLIDDDHLCLVIADVSGKGIPASLFMMNSKMLIKTLALSGNSPAEVLEKANRDLCDNNRMEMFVTVWLGILELSTGKLTCANAGHEYPALSGTDGHFSLVKDRHGFVIGGMEGVKYKDYELQLEPGGKLFVYTDGVPEATNAAKKLFGTDRMLEALNSDENALPEQILQNVGRAVEAFVGKEEKFDDLTMLALQYFGPDPK